MLFALTSIFIAVAALLLFYACFGLGNGKQGVDNMELAYALEEINPSDYHSYAVAPVNRQK